MSPYDLCIVGVSCNQTNNHNRSEAWITQRNIILIRTETIRQNCVETKRFLREMVVSFRKRNESKKTKTMVCQMSTEVLKERF